MEVAERAVEGEVGFARLKGGEAWEPIWGVLD